MDITDVNYGNAVIIYGLLIHDRCNTLNVIDQIYKNIPSEFLTAYESDFKVYDGGCAYDSKLYLINKFIATIDEKLFVILTYPDADCTVNEADLCLSYKINNSDTFARMGSKAHPISLFDIVSINTSNFQKVVEMVLRGVKNVELDCEHGINPRLFAMPNIYFP